MRDREEFHDDRFSEPADSEIVVIEHAVDPLSIRFLPPTQVADRVKHPLEFRSARVIKGAVQLRHNTRAAVCTRVPYPAKAV